LCTFTEPLTYRFVPSTSVCVHTRPRLVATRLGTVVTSPRNNTHPHTQPVRGHLPSLPMAREALRTRHTGHQFKVGRAGVITRHGRAEFRLAVLIPLRLVTVTHTGHRIAARVGTSPFPPSLSPTAVGPFIINIVVWDTHARTQYSERRCGLRHHPSK
jgi:hypothetical protein